MINKNTATKVLLELLRIPGPSGGEKLVADYIVSNLLNFGVKKSWIRFDSAHKKIGNNFEIGNLIVKIPGKVKGPGVLFSAHMDTVPLCRGAVPLIKGKQIVSKGQTGLGGDDRAGVGCILTLVETLHRLQIPHPPLTLVFLVGEELGLFGSRHIEVQDLGDAQMGFNYDGGDPYALEIGAIGSERWEIIIHGHSSHAGMAPEKGVSSALIFADAVKRLHKLGFLGKITKKEGKGTANIGIVKGGEVTNQVLDHLYVKGEARCHNPKFLNTIVQTILNSFAQSAATIKSSDNKRGKCTFNCWTAYQSYCLPQNSPVVKYATETIKSIGSKPAVAVAKGGLDASHLNQKGIPTITLGVGWYNAHTVDEFVNIDHYLQACELGVKLATSVMAKV